MEHLSDVGTRFTGAMTTSPVFVEPCFMLYPSSLQDGLCFFRPLYAVPPWACLTVGLPYIAHGGLTAFPRST